MKKWKSIPLLGSVVLFIICMIGIFYILKPDSTDDPLTEDDAVQLVKQLYGGKVLAVKAADDAFIIQNERKEGVYGITIDRETGSVREVEKLKEKKEKVHHKTKTEENKENPEKQDAGSEAEEKKSVRITQDDAVKIAQNYLPGTVDDVELEENEHGIYYIVEIENGEDEAEIQVHAITGEIISVTRDD